MLSPKMNSSLRQRMSGSGEMLAILLVFGLVVVSETGVIHQHQAGVGLNYHQYKSYLARPTIRRPYIAPTTGHRPAPIVPSIVFNSVPFNHAITPITGTRVASPLLFPQTSTITKLLPTVSSVHLATLSNNIPSVPLNLLPINPAIQEGTSNIKFSPAIGFNNQPATIPNAPVGPPLSASSAVRTITSVNVIPEKSVSYSLSHQDYEYLKRHKVEGKDSPYNPIPGFNTSPHNEKHQNSHSHHNHDNVQTNNPQKVDSASALERSAGLKSAIQGYREIKFVQNNNSPGVIQGNINNSFKQGKNDLNLIQGNIESSFTPIYGEQNNIQSESGPSLINNPEPTIQGNSKTSFLQPCYNKHDQLQGNSETNFIQTNSGSINIDGNSGPSFVNVPEPAIQGNIENSFLQQSSNELDLIQENGESFTRGNSVPTFIQGNVEPSFLSVVEPVVSKDIYFHVPPPDLEEPPRAPIANLPTPKKTYNILFIKAPSQNQQSDIYLQQLLQRQNQIDEKTLIYVLSQKQDSVDAVLPPQQTSKVSSPEVYFVKYKTKLADIPDISNENVEQSLVENISSSSSGH